MSNVIPIHRASEAMARRDQALAAQLDGATPEEALEIIRLNTLPGLKWACLLLGQPAFKGLFEEAVLQASQIKRAERPEPEEYR